jgi:UDPglucose--hexose-1-phosphate uridylyltransferase
MVTTEIRLDPITGRSVVIDLTPSKPRSDFEPEPAPRNWKPEPCPFCEGQEELTGHELLAWREGTPANSPGWAVRVVPNRVPLLRIEATNGPRVNGVLTSHEGLGAHEVVIETPRHDEPLHALSTDAICRVLWAWRTRLQDLKRDARFVSAIVFKNHGRASGARMDHSHSQILTSPFLPPQVDDKVRGAAGHFKQTGRCIFCDIIEQELKQKLRTVSDTGPIIAIAPYASRLPFETWLLPRDHQARFEDASDAALGAMAAVLKETLERINWALEDPAYNLALHTAPFHGEQDDSFHWHLEILPRVTRVSGLEWGSGLTRNPMPPEAAAKWLRDAPARVEAGH